MSIDFYLTSKTKNDVFKDNASINDISEYNIDCTAWEEDNDIITTATWTIENGSGVSISNKTVTDGIVSSLINFSNTGRNLISVLIATAAGIKKKFWLEIKVKDVSNYNNDNDYSF